MSFLRSMDIRIVVLPQARMKRVGKCFLRHGTGATIEG